MSEKQRAKFGLNHHSQAKVQETSINPTATPAAGGSSAMQEAPSIDTAASAAGHNLTAQETSVSITATSAAGGSSTMQDTPSIGTAASAAGHSPPVQETSSTDTAASAAGGSPTVRDPSSNATTTSAASVSSMMQEPTGNATATSAAEVNPTLQETSVSTTSTPAAGGSSAVVATSNIANGARAHLSPIQASCQQRRRNGTARNISNMELNTVPRRRARVYPALRQVAAAKREPIPTSKLNLFLRRPIKSSDSVVRIPGIGRKFAREIFSKMRTRQASQLLSVFRIQCNWNEENFRNDMLAKFQDRVRNAYIQRCVRALRLYKELYF